MISETTIQVNNCIEVSLAYLNRFFSAAGEIQKIQKDQPKKLVYIHFKNKNSPEKAFRFNGRTLYKKPIHIKMTTYAMNQAKSQKSIGHEKIQQKIVSKVPCLHEINTFQYKMQTRSGYRLIQTSDFQDNQIKFKNNPLEGMKDKAYLWKVILHEMTKNISNVQGNNRELILSISLGVWALIQLKLRQIEHILTYNDNQKSKYIENLIQEIVSNKLILLKNSNIVNNAHRFKTSFNESLIQLSFSVTYPDQTQQEAKYLCKANQKMHNFLCLLYTQSEILGKIYHQLHSNSFIVFQKRPVIQRQVLTFLDKSFLQSLQQKDEKKGQKDFQEEIKSKQVLINSQENTTNHESNQFSGWLQNYGLYIFHNILSNMAANNANAVIWIEIENNKIQSYFPHPGFFYCNFIFQGCLQKNISQKSFTNIYTVNISKRELVLKQKINLLEKAIVFQEGQFSFQQIRQFTLNFIRFEFRKTIVRNQQAAKSASKESTTQYHSVICLHSQSVSPKQKAQKSQNLQNPIHKQAIRLSLSIIFVGIYIKKQSQSWLYVYNQLKDQIQNLISKYQATHEAYSFEVQTDFSLIQILTDRQKQFNAFKCQNYLISYIDRHIIRKNSIIASEQFAQKLAQKILQEAHGNKLFGFKDKRYIGSELWRLYNKSGARRAKQKIQEYSTYKKIKNQ